MLRIISSVVGSFLLVAASLTLSIQYLSERGVQVQGPIDSHGTHYFLAAVVLIGFAVSRAKSK